MNTKTRIILAAIASASLLMGAAVIGYQDWQLRGSTPGNPASGFVRMWADNSTGKIKAITSAGAALFFDSASSGTVTSVATTSPISGGTITSTGTIACATCVTAASSLTSGQLMTGAGSQGSQVSNLSGAVTTSGSAATTLAVEYRRRVCSMVIGADNAIVALATTDLAPQGRQCFVPFAATVVEVTVAGDDGTPNVVVAKNHAGSLSDFTSSALATASAGALACSNTGGTTGLDGATTCSSTLQNTSLAAGDWIETHTATAGGVAKRMSIAVTYTVN